MDLARTFCALAALLAGVYLLLAQSLAALEIVAAAGSGILATLALLALLNTEPVSFSFGLRWPSGFLLVPYKVVHDSLLILGVLPGLLLHRREHVGAFQHKSSTAAGDSPEAAALRALSVIEISMPPNTYVAEVSASDGTETIHRLVGAHPARE